MSPPTTNEQGTPIALTERWFAAQDWRIFDFQHAAWEAWHQGRSGLIHSPTGSGKTLAAWLGPVQHEMEQAREKNNDDTLLRVLWITPLRALASDTHQNLQAACDGLGLDVHVDIRTGDTSGHRRKRQRSAPPFALVTTPESLSVMLSYPGAEIGLGGIHTVIVDEWHELMGSKRGVQLQLCLARLRRLCGQLRIWGVSATIANLDLAMDVLLGHGHRGQLIRGVMPRTIAIETLLPEQAASFKWSGHLGLQLLQPVIRKLECADTTLLFTNTRAQAERWFQALLEARPDWLDCLALHHGSLDRQLRTQIEARLDNGELRCVVCTSSLDLGVDFRPVDQVMQAGSPKGIARLVQRAGRSGHRPGAVSKMVCIPTQALELVEIAAARRAIQNGHIEGREPPVLSLDVLSQHLVTIAMGSGFIETAMREEVCSTHAFATLSDTQWQWVMDFITRGGQALQGYPQYHKVLNVVGTCRVMNNEIQTRHRMSIGTITSDTQLSVSLKGGKRLGSIEESFLARLNPGDTFQFAGRHLQLIRIRETTAQVKLATQRSRITPRWSGAQLPLSSALADQVQHTLHLWQQGTMQSPELACIAETLELQRRWSCLPGPDDFLIESISTREGHSLFCYPFAGRLAHEGLAMVMAMRLSSDTAATFTLQCNDYGFELKSPDPLEIDLHGLRHAMRTEHLLDDILDAVNAGEVAKRRFRDIARIAGLVFEGYPGRGKSARQVQASSGLIYEVLVNHDADNLLLEQARREVLEQQLEYARLRAVLEALEQRQWHLCHPERLTPLSFPIWTESLNSQTISSESFEQRVESMLASLEQASEDHLKV